jgi:hypothetical protein
MVAVFIFVPSAAAAVELSHADWRIITVARALSEQTVIGATERSGLHVPVGDGQTG